MDSVEEIKSRIDILDIVSENVQLRRSGTSHVGFCPFHSNTKTPSFRVFPNTGTWYCFGECGEGGDVFSFLMKKEGWDFSETLKYLAERAGVDLRPPTPEQAQQKEESDRLRDLLEEVVQYYHHLLLTSAAGKPALDYLLKRGLTDESIKQFQLGYSPDKWDAVQHYFNKKGYTNKELEKVGLVYERDKGGFNDRFRHRAMIPIRDSRGRMAGFGGRALKPDEPAKYINTPQTELFDKSTILFGFDRSKKFIREKEEVVIVEGYLDVITLHQAGYQNVVAQMGTALTQQHMRQIKRLTQRIILALDADAAGAKATLRGLEVARETLDRETEISFDPRGLLQQEGRLKADIRVTTLPEGMDPDMVIRTDPERWKEIISNARPVVLHVMETLARGKDLDDPKVKTEIAAQIVPLIRDVASPIERDTYVQQLARFIRVSEDALNREFSQNKPARRTPRRQPADMVRVEQKPANRRLSTDFESTILLTSRMETHCLGILLREPQMTWQLDRELQNYGLQPLTAKDFRSAQNSEILEVMLKGLDQDNFEPLNYLCNNLPEDLVDLTDIILSETEQEIQDKDRLFEDLLFTIVRMREQQIHQQNDHYKFQLEDTAAEENSTIAEISNNILQNARALQLLQKAIAQYNKP